RSGLVRWRSDGPRGAAEAGEGRAGRSGRPTARAGDRARSGCCSAERAAEEPGELLGAAVAGVQGQSFGAAPGEAWPAHAARAQPSPATAGRDPEAAPRELPRLRGGAQEDGPASGGPQPGDRAATGPTGGGGGVAVRRGLRGLRGAHGGRVATR